MDVQRCEICGRPIHPLWDYEGVCHRCVQKWVVDIAWDLDIFYRKIGEPLSDTRIEDDKSQDGLTVFSVDAPFDFGEKRRR
jgi:hypothetical protein